MDPLHGAIIEAEFRIGVLESVVDKLIAHASKPSFTGGISIPLVTDYDMRRIREDALEKLKEKSPAIADDLKLT